MTMFARFSLVLAGCLALMIYGPVFFGQCNQCGSCPHADQCPSGMLLAASGATDSTTVPAGAARETSDPTKAPDAGAAETTATAPVASVVPVPDPKKPRPKMIDLGAGACIPCKKMKPILEQATIDYQGYADIVFIDVWKDRSQGPQYGIRMIPTQIFFDADGKEVSRHEGFMAREEIDQRLAEMGVKLPAGPAVETASSSTPEGK